MKIRDIMRTPVVTIGQDATLREVVALLSTARVSGLPVVNQNEHLIGIATEHDIIKALLPTYEDILSSDTGLLNTDLMASHVYQVRDNPITSIMTKNVITLAEDDSILKAATTVILKKVKRLPVLRDRKPIGIVSRLDIVQAVIHGII